jgi:hypothetical protein
MKEIFTLNAKRQGNGGKTATDCRFLGTNAVF